MIKKTKGKMVILPFIPKRNFSALDLLVISNNNSKKCVLEFLVKQGEIYSSLIYKCKKSKNMESSREKFLNIINLHFGRNKLTLINQEEFIEDYKVNFDEHFNIQTNYQTQTLVVSGWEANQLKMLDKDIISKILALLSQQSEIKILIQLSLNFIEKDTGLINGPLYVNEIEEKIDNKNKLLQIEDTNIHNNFKNIVNFSLIFNFLSIEENNKLYSITCLIKNYLELNGFKTRNYPSFFVEKDQIFNILKKRLRKFTIKIKYENLNLIFNLVNNELPFWKKFREYPPFLNNELNSSKNDNSILIGSQIKSRNISTNKVFLPLSLFSSHMNIWGMTGEGKSRLLYHLSSQFMEKKINVMIVDLKGEYKYALGQCPNISYFRPGSNEYPILINIFEVPGELNKEEESHKHIDFILNIIYKLLGEYELTSQMNFLLRKAITYTVKNSGNFIHFMKVINNPRLYGINKNKIELSSEALNNRLNRIISGLMRKIFFVKESNFSISHLANNNVLIDLEEFENLENDQGRKFFIEVLLNNYIYYFKEKKMPIRGKEEISNIIIFDEAQKIIPEKKRKEYSDEQSIIGKSVWTLRSYGVSMIFSGTEPAIEQSVRINAGITISFFTKFDAIVMSNILGLPMKDYLLARSLLEERFFLLSQKGNVSLVKSPDFLVNQFTTLDIVKKKEMSE